MEEKKLSSKLIYQGKIFDIYVDKVLLANNKKASREIVKHAEVVAVLPILDNGKILLVKQYRSPVQATTLELPAGRLNRNELPTSAVGRELREETGFISNKIEKMLSFYPAIGYSTERIHLYIAKELKEDLPDPDEDEIIENRSYSLDECLSMIKDGTISDGKSIIGLIYYAWKNKDKEDHAIFQS